MSNGETTIAEKIDFIKKTATRDYQSNLISYGDKKYLPAGGHQFYTLWVRDFCYSVPGLLKNGEQKLVADQLDLIFSSMDSDGLLPRGLDVVNPKLRVVLNTVLRFLPGSLKKPKYEGRNIKPEFKGEHGTIAFDSLLLVPWALAELCLSMEDSKSSQEILEKYQSQLSLIFKRLKSTVRNDLFWQDPFSDWQDSTKREGHIFTSHVLYLRLKTSADKLKMDWFASLEWPTEKKIFDSFYDVHSGLFKNSLNRDQLYFETQNSLEAHAWVLQDRLFENLDHQGMYNILKKTELWRHVGYPVYPQTPDREVALTTKLVGLARYHDGLVWGWLLAEAYNASCAMNDTLEAHRILDEFVSAVKNHRFIYEVYRRKSGQLIPFDHPLYQSEYPFTWAACKWLEAL